MKRSTKIIAAVVLSIGVVTGAAAFGKHKFGDPAKKAAHVVSYIADELDLDTSQEQALGALKDEMLAAAEIMHKDGEPLKTDIQALMSAETFDQGKALEMITSKTAAINEAAPTLVAALGNFLDGLNADQKAEVLEFMDHKGGRHGRHGHGNW